MLNMKATSLISSYHRENDEVSANAADMETVAQQLNQRIT